MGKPTISMVIFSNLRSRANSQVKTVLTDEISFTFTPEARRGNCLDDDLQWKTDVVSILLLLLLMLLMMIMFTIVIMVSL
jgi:hypothetical protein